VVYRKCGARLGPYGGIAVIVVCSVKTPGSESHSVVLGGIWSVVQHGGSRLIGLVVFLCLARLLSPDVWGVMAALAAFVFVGDLIVEQGLGYAIVQRAEVSASHLDTVFWVQLSVALITSCLAVVFAPCFVGYFVDEGLVNCARVLLLTPIVTALGAVHQAMLMRQLSFKQLALRQIIGNCVGGFSAVVCAFLGAGVWALVIQQVVTAVVGTCALWFSSRWRPGFEVRLQSLRELMNFSISLFAHRGLLILSNHAGRLLIAATLGPAVLGLYVAALRIVDTALSLLVAPFSQLLLPVFAKMQSDPEKLAPAYLKALHVAMFFSVPASVGISILSDEIAIIFLGAQWDAAGPVIKVLGSLILARAVGGVSSTVLLALGGSFKRLMVVLFYTLGKLVLFLFFVKFGVIVLCWIHVLAQFVSIPLYNFIIRRSFVVSMRDCLLIVFPIVAVGVSMGLVLSGLGLVLDGAVQPVVGLLLKVAFASLFYVAFVYIFSRESRDLIGSVFLILSRKFFGKKA
jgi:O-antigen/teichoic acid export membrane protein